METEAKIFSRYLVGKTATPENVAEYVRAVETLTTEYSAAEQKVASLVMKVPILVGSVDAGLALLDRRSNFRYRIYIMLAILETDPQLAHLFLSKDYNILDWIKTFFVGVRSVLRMIFGVIILKLIVRYG